MFIVLNIRRSLRTAQSFPGIGTHTDTFSSPEREFRPHAAVYQSHIYLSPFHQVPITAGWAEALWSEKSAQKLLHIVGWCRESNPRPSDHESGALTIQLYASTFDKVSHQQYMSKL